MDIVSQEYVFGLGDYSSGGWRPVRAGEEEGGALTLEDFDDQESDEEVPSPTRISGNAHDLDHDPAYCIDGAYALTEIDSGGVGVLAVHLGCLRLACAWTEKESGQELFTHPTGGCILPCSCLSQSFGPGIRDDEGASRAEINQERKAAGLFDFQHCQLGRHSLHKQPWDPSPAQNRYFSDRARFHGVDFDVPFEIMRWDDWYNVYEFTLEYGCSTNRPAFHLPDKDEWVMAPPERFPSLPALPKSSRSLQSLLLLPPVSAAVNRHRR
ncbi:hypothetical protein HDU88_006363 [Geranomyces variabilis]|nr:hypothetical protein HDU88_006363 [Geranomyces variabilis]